MVSNTVAAMAQTKETIDILEKMEENDKMLVRAVRGLVVQIGSAITFIDTSATITWDRFNMLLFCNTGLIINICSMKTARKRGARPK